MGAYIPAVVSHKIAMLGRLHNHRVTHGKSCAWYAIFVWLLVAVESVQCVSVPPLETRGAINGLFPVVEGAVDAELLHWEVTITSL